MARRRPPPRRPWRVRDWNELAGRDAMLAHPDDPPSAGAVGSLCGFDAGEGGLITRLILAYAPDCRGTFGATHVHLVGEPGGQP